jgi:hypothetical protein
MLGEKRIAKMAIAAAPNKGYTVYDDYNEASRQLIYPEGSFEPTHAGWYLFIIKRTMIQMGRRFKKHRPPRFYPTSSP